MNRTGTCRVGPHEFTLDEHFPLTQPLPDVCYSHWYTEQVDQAQAEHQVLFAEVERLTGLKGHIEQTGGMTMTITIPLPSAATEGDNQGFPCYLGLKEGEDEQGRWAGSLSLLRTYDEDEGERVFLGYGEDARTPQEWAALLAAHYATLREPVLVQDLYDGDVFSLDGGATWHTCAVVLFGNVAVYSDSRRGEDAPTVRIDAARELEVLRQRT